MALGVKRVVDGCVNIQKALRRAWRLETLLLAFSSPDGLVRILCLIIGALSINMFSRQAERPKGDMVGFEFIGCDPGWRLSLFLQQFTHQLQRCLGVPL
jgi:hypothetical protein